MSQTIEFGLDFWKSRHMKNISICLFVIGLSVIGCDNKPAAKPALPVASPSAAAHAMAPPVAGATTDAHAADKKDDAHAADKKDDAPAADKKPE